MAGGVDWNRAIQDPRYLRISGMTIFTLIFIVAPLLMWLEISIVDQSPVAIAIEDFSIASVESTNGLDLNQSVIYFKLSLGNGAEWNGLYYDNLNLTFSYYTSESDIVRVGRYTIPGFHQGMGKKTSREDYVVTTPGISWRGISVLSLSPSVSSSVVFRVDVATAVRFAECFTSIKSKRLEVMAWCDVEVDQLTGKKVSKKAIKLKHLIVDHISGWLWFACFIIVILALLSPLSGCCWVALFPELLG